MDLNLREHVAVIFGAASGIGRAIAEAFVRESATTVLVDRDPQVLRAGFAAIAGKNTNGATRQVDVTDLAALEELRDFLLRSMGPPRHLVFAVGAGSGKVGFPFWNVPPSDWQRVLEVNLIGAVNVAHVFGPLLAEQQQGTMLFLSSVAGQIGSPTDPPYSAAKAAVINFAQVAARDLAPHNVRVNVIAPGMVPTPLNRAVWAAWNERQPDEAKLSYEAWGEEKVKRVAPLGRWQTPEDIAALAVFLASDFAKDITGQTLNIDGGQVMHS